MVGQASSVHHDRANVIGPASTADRLKVYTVASETTLRGASEPETNPEPMAT